MKDIPYFTKLGGKFMEVRTMDDLCIMLKEKFESQQRVNNALQEENKKLKDGIWEKEEVARLKTEYDRMQEQYRSAFIVTNEQWEAIRNWQELHTQEKHGGNHYRGGAIGGSYHYVFTPTGIGTFGKVECSCGESFDFAGDF